MGRTAENTAFVCAHCRKAVVPVTNGGYRNHCPHCLFSLHVDNAPGDRACGCMGLMKPIDVVFSSKKGYQLVHRCQSCGAVKTNRVAADTDMPDDLRLIARLMNGET